MFRTAMKMIFAVASVATLGTTPVGAQNAPRPWQPGFVQPLTTAQPAAQPTKSPFAGMVKDWPHMQPAVPTEWDRLGLALPDTPRMDTAALPRSRGIVTAYSKSFPNLGEDYEVVEPETRACKVCIESCYQRNPKTGEYIVDPGMCIPGTYNCIAYTTGIKNIWVSPFQLLDGWDKYFERPGYVRMRAANTSHQAGYQKVAVYGKFTPEGKLQEFTHASLENDDGTWTSKLGSGPLVRHRSAESVCGPSYGEVVLVYMRKK